MEAIVAGPDDHDLAAALEAEGVAVTRLTGVVTRPDLEEAGICAAALYVLTDASQATTIPIALDLNEELRTVAYTARSLPEFVSGQLDLAVDPAIADATLLAEEIANPP